MKFKQDSRGIRFCPRLIIILLLGIVFMLTFSLINNADFVMSFRTRKLITDFEYSNHLMSDNIGKYNDRIIKYSDDLRHETWAPVTKENGSMAGSKTGLLDRSQTYIILNEKLCSNLEDIFVVVLIHSAINNFERRKFIRSTWGNITIFESPRHRFRIVFMLGKPDKEQNQIAINLENNQYGDIVQRTFLDTYKNLTHKALLGLRWEKEYCKRAQFVLKVDDDVIINTPRLFTHLTNKYSHVNKTIFCAVVRPKDKFPIFVLENIKLKRNSFLI